MTLSDFLADLRRQEIHLSADGDRLRVKAPAGGITPELRQQMQQRKQELLDFLRAAEAVAKQPPAIVPLQPRGSRTPVFAVAGHNGDVFAYRALAEHLGPDQPFYGLRPPGLDGGSEAIDRVEDLAAYFAGQILTFRQRGPFVLAGYCAGGPIAMHTAGLLARWGAGIDFVAMFGCPYPPFYRHTNLKTLPERVGVRARAIAGSPGKYLADLPSRLRRGSSPIAAPAHDHAADDVAMRKARLEETTLEAVRRYAPVPFGGPVHLFVPNRSWARWPAMPLRWRAHAPLGTVSFGPDDCQWFNMLQTPFAGAIADLFVRARDQRAVGAA